MGNCIASCVRENPSNETRKQDHSEANGSTKKEQIKRSDSILRNDVSISQPEHVVPSDATLPHPIDFDALLNRPLERYYKMDHPNRGVAIIFNHEHFFEQSLYRKGTEVDRYALKKTFKSLGFDVQVHDDLMENEIFNVLENVAAMDHSNNDCLIVTVLSHGDIVPIIDRKTNKEKNTILSHDLMSHLHAKDNMYPMQKILSYFTDEKCPTLIGKPRLFFIQACQGDKVDGGSLMHFEEDYVQKEVQTNSVVDIKPFRSLYHDSLERVMPQEDFLVVYPTLPGFFSFRSTANGVWYVQALCDELINRNENDDLMTILTFINQRIAYDFESNNENNAAIHGKKQIPCVSSMLRKKILFPK